MTGHGIEINGSIPQWLKLIMVFIDRVGFPILAFVLMFYMCQVSIKHTTETMQQAVSMLSEWQVSTVEFRKATVSRMDCLANDHRQILINQDRIVDKVQK